jgi:hypothetical protein
MHGRNWQANLEDAGMAESLQGLYLPGRERRYRYSHDARSEIYHMALSVRRCFGGGGVLRHAAGASGGAGQGIAHWGK